MDEDENENQLLPQDATDADNESALPPDVGSDPLTPSATAPVAAPTAPMAAPQAAPAGAAPAPQFNPGFAPPGVVPQPGAPIKGAGDGDPYSRMLAMIQQNNASNHDLVAKAIAQQPDIIGKLQQLSA